MRVSRRRGKMSQRRYRGQAAETKHAYMEERHMRQPAMSATVARRPRRGRRREEQEAAVARISR